MDWGLIMGIAALAISVLALAFAWGAVSRQHQHELEPKWHHAHVKVWPTPENIAATEEELLGEQPPPS